MKNYIYGLLLFSFIVSCDNKVDDVFDVPANQRVKNLMKKCDSTLLASTDGWVCDYESGRGDKFRIFLSFKKDNKVTMYSDFDNSDATTQYAYNESQGPVLSFSTYSVLHKLADPVFTATADDKQGKSFEGDYEFVILSVHSDSIVFKGLKRQNEVIFKKSTAETKNEMLLRKQNVYNFLNRIKGMEKPFIVIQKAGNSVVELKDNSSPNSFFSTTWAEMAFTVVSEDGDGYKTEKIAIADVTENGFTLEKEIIIADVNVKKFVWNETKGKYVAESDASIVITDAGLPFMIDKEALSKVGKFSYVETYSDAFLQDYIVPLKQILPVFTTIQLYNKYGSGAGFSEIDLFCNEGTPRWSGLGLDNTSPFIVSPEREDVFVFNYNNGWGGYWPTIINEPAGKNLYNFFIGADRKFIINMINNSYFKITDIENPKYSLVFKINS